MRLILTYLLLTMTLALFSCGPAPIGFREADPSLGIHGLKREAQHLSELVQAQRNLNKQLKKDRKNLTRALTLDVDTGCYLKETLDHLTIELTTDERDDELIAKEKKRSFGEFASSTHLSIELAPGLSFKVKKKSFNKKSSKNTAALASYTLKDIQYLKITKPENTFRIVSHLTNRGCGFLWRKSCDQYLLYETNIWHVTGVKLQLSGVSIYENPMLDLTFAGDHLSWADLQLKHHSAYQEALKRDDCLVKKF